MQECGVGLGGTGRQRIKRALYAGLYVDSGEIKAVYERIDESVFSYCVYSSGALCLPDAEDESDGNETQASAMNFCLFVPLQSGSLLNLCVLIKLAAL